LPHSALGSPELFEEKCREMRREGEVERERTPLALVSCSGFEAAL